MLSLVEHNNLWGKTKMEYAEIFKWLSLSNMEFLPYVALIFQSAKGVVPYNKLQVDKAHAALEKITAVFEQRLSKYTYLVGERLSYADYFVAFEYVRAFENIYDTAWRKQHPAIVRWFNTVAAQPLFKAGLDKVEFCAEAVKYTPPKKEKKAAAPKAEPKKEAAPNKDAVEAPPAEAPKPKHPLEALGKAKQPLDEWKRIYSNKETREEAIPWFWDNMYDPSEWSLWKVDYKYNDELTMTFMSNNLVGGFFNRLTASSKYMFGCVLVYGVNNDNVITGFFLVRGQEYAPGFDVAPDWESYSYTKLDASDDGVKKFINNMLAWDEPIELDGRSIEIADGKVFK